MACGNMGRSGKGSGKASAIEEARESVARERRGGKQQQQQRIAKAVAATAALSRVPTGVVMGMAGAAAMRMTVVGMVMAVSLERGGGSTYQQWER